MSLNPHAPSWSPSPLLPPHEQRELRIGLDAFSSAGAFATEHDSPLPRGGGRGSSSPEGWQSPYTTPKRWIAPLEAAERRLLLAQLHHGRLGAGSPGAHLRERQLISAVAALLPAGRAPLAFTAFPHYVEASETGNSVAKSSADRWGKYRTAVCTDAPMSSGVHFAEFTLLQRAGWLRVGVANADLSASDPSYGVHAADIGGSNYAFDATCGGSATATSHAWGLNTALGSLWHNSGFEDWVGQRAAEAGDTVGLLLDVDVGCIDVFLNRVRLGRMVDRSLALAAAPTRGSGALCWMVELHDVADKVRIEGREPPHPLPTRSMGQPWAGGSRVFVGGSRVFV